MYSAFRSEDTEALLPLKTSEHCSYSLRKRKHYYQLPNVEFSRCIKTVLLIDACLSLDDTVVVVSSKAINYLHLHRMAVGMSGADND